MIAEQQSVPTPSPEWSRQALTLPLFCTILVSYAPFARDSLSWLDFAQALSRGYVYTHPDGGWLVFMHTAPDKSAEVHGGRWHESTDVMAGLVWRDARTTLIPSVMKELGVNVLNTFVPEGFDSVLHFVEYIGFHMKGRIPLGGTYDGVPRDLLVYSYRREV